MRTAQIFVITMTVLSVMTPVAWTQEQAAWLSPELGNAKLATSYSFTTFFNEPVARQGTKMGMMQHSFRLSFPLTQDEQREWTMQTRFGVMDIDTDSRLPDTRERFPGELWDVRVGTTYRQRLANGWIGGGNLTIGSPSDRPFASGDEILVNATGFLIVPESQRSSWMFFLNYANNRDFLRNIPLPGVVYDYRPDERLRMLAGVPASMVRWTPTERLALEASYFIPRTVHARVSYDLVEALQLYAGFDWSNQRYFRHDRRDDDDRLFYYEKQVAIGARCDIHQNVWLDLSGGWAFDRFWFEGEDYGDRGDNRLGLSDGPMVKFQLGLHL